MIHNSYLVKEARAWIKHQKGPDEIVRIIPDLDTDDTVLSYEIFTAFDETPGYLGRILFDMQGYWIYDGDILSVTEQEQVARFIINYVETI